MDFDEIDGSMQFLYCKLPLISPYTFYKNYKVSFLSIQANKLLFLSSNNFTRWYKVVDIIFEAKIMSTLGSYCFCKCYNLTMLDLKIPA